MKNPFETGPIIPKQEKPEISLSIEKLQFDDMGPVEQKKNIMEAMKTIGREDIIALDIADIIGPDLDQKIRSTDRLYTINTCLHELENEGKIERTHPGGRGYARYKVIEK